ncbi:unnamed protein product [Trifolium pratense]|uniref:Uncharacterized protein n=1 Tax=Trifolium pratense TaxID=57577 RepID=A0ACB0LN07_TRIPR|nr:unnamed protein product [Trifolium pratense]
MQKLENMDKIFKFVNVMIIIFSLFLASTRISHADIPIPCKIDRDCPVATISQFRRPKRMRCRKGYCIG